MKDPIMKPFYGLGAVGVLTAAAIFAACASQDPGSYEIVPRRTAGGPPIAGGTPTVPGTPTPDAGGPVTTQTIVFDKPFVAGTGDVATIQSKHLNAMGQSNGGPQSIADAKKTDCTATCHKAGGTAPAFLIGGVTKPNAEVGIRLQGESVAKTTRASKEGFFFLETGGSVVGSKVSVRDSPTNESAMNAPPSSGGCNQLACHGGPPQGDIFRGK
jgi:hypothetical protein